LATEASTISEKFVTFTEPRTIADTPGKVFDIQEEAMAGEPQAVRIAAIGDVHCTKTSQGVLQPLFQQINESADILLLCGDLTDFGLPEEAQVLAKELTTSLKIPVVAVLGNHDFESGQPQEVERILCDAGVRMLDGDGCELHGIGFAGAKGFAGGFGAQALQAWGEESIKHFVHEAIDEALKLEKAISRLQTSQRVVLLHYSPVRATVEGEPPELFPFLGSSRLEETLNRYPVTAIFHGHAHHGSPEGRTQRDVPVYNVALPLLRRVYPNQPPFRLEVIPVIPPSAHDGKHE
jgi:Icc-related predicted phosphoesterase